MNDNNSDITVKVSYKFVPMTGSCVYPTHKEIIEGLGNDGWEFVSVVDMVDSSSADEKYANAKMMFKRTMSAASPKPTNTKTVLND